MIGKLLCWLGLHNDGTTAFGGYSDTCLRCDKPTYPVPAAQSYDYPVQYEVRVRVNVNARTPAEAVAEARVLLQSYRITADVIDPRGRRSQIREAG